MKGMAVDMSDLKEIVGDLYIKVVMLEKQLQCVAEFKPEKEAKDVTHE